MQTTKIEMNPTSFTNTTLLIQTNLPKSIFHPHETSLLKCNKYRSSFCVVQRIPKSFVGKKHPDGPGFVSFPIQPPVAEAGEMGEWASSSGTPSEVDFLEANNFC